jgi:hypothetical protein
MLQGPPPTTRGLGPARHASWPRTEEAKPLRADRVTAQRLRALPHFRPDQRVKGRITMQAACNCTKGTHPFDFDASNMGSRPTRHVTGVPVTTCEKLHRHLRQYHAFSTAEPVPQLEATLRMVQQCQPSTSVTGQSAAGEDVTVDMAKSGPAVMAARPLLGQRESPLPWREDDVPMFRSSNGSRIHNGCPANHSSRRINSAAGLATPLAGEAGDASPPPS